MCRLNTGSFNPTLNNYAYCYSYIETEQAQNINLTPSLTTIIHCNTVPLQQRFHHRTWCSNAHNIFWLRRKIYNSKQCLAWSSKSCLCSLSIAERNLMSSSMESANCWKQFCRPWPRLFRLQKQLDWQRLERLSQPSSHKLPFGRTARSQWSGRIRRRSISLTWIAIIVR